MARTDVRGYENIKPLQPLTIFAGNPPTQVEVQVLINRLNDLLAAMKR